MPDSDLQITFGADASGAVKGCADVKSAVGGVAPNVAALGQSFADLADKAKGGFEGLSSALAGLKTAGSGGAESLAGVAEAASGAAAAAGAIVDVAGAAAGALTDWAQNTVKSSSASDAARGSASRLLDAMNAAGGVFGQVGDLLGSAFAPVLTDIVRGLSDLATAFVESDRSGGVAKLAIDAIAVMLKVLVDSIDIALTSIGALWNLIKSAWDGFAALFARSFQDIGRDLDSLVADFQAFGKVAVDALSSNFQALAADAPAALAQVQSSVRTIGADMAGEVHAFVAAAAPDWNQFGADGEAAVQRISTSFDDAKGKLAGGLPPPSSVTTAPGVAGGPSPDGEPPAHQHRGRGEGHHHRAAASTAGAGAPSSVEAGGAAQAKQLDSQATNDKQQSLDQQTQATLQAIDQQTQAAEQGVAQQLAVTKSGIENQIKAVQQAAAAGQISRDQALSQVAALHQKETAAEEAAVEQQIAIVQAGYAAKLQAGAQSLGQQIAIGNKAIQAQVALVNQLTAISAAGDRQQVKDADDAAKAYRQSWSGVISPVVSSFSRGLMQMAEGTKSFTQVMRQFGQQILNDLIKQVDKMVTSWASGQLAQVQAAVAGNAGKTAADKAGASQSLLISAEAGLKKVFNEARQAAAGAYNAMADVPLVGPELGAAASAATFAAVMALGVMQSAAGGYDIPSGVNPLTQLHQQEMVLPARLANPMRAMLSDYGSSAGAAPAGHSFSFGDFNIHGAPGGMSSGEFRQALDDHAEHVAGAVAGALRGGWRPNYKQPTGAL